MSWAKLDDKLHGHPKIGRLLMRKGGLEALGLWTLALSHAADYLTDGEVDLALVTQKAGSRGPALAGLLVDAGLWEAAAEGWRFHDYLDRNPSREAELERRAHQSELKARAGRAGGVRSGEARRASPASKQTREAEADAKHRASLPLEAERSATKLPIPIPIPIPIPSSSVPSERVGEAPAAPPDQPEPLRLEASKPARTPRERRHPATGPDGPITHALVRAVIACLADASGVSQAVQPPSAEWWFVVDRLGERPAAELCQAIALACADPFRRRAGKTSLRSILGTSSAVAEALALGVPGNGSRPPPTRQERQRAEVQAAIADAEAAAAERLEATDVARIDP